MTDEERRTGDIERFDGDRRRLGSSPRRDGSKPARRSERTVESRQNSEPSGTALDDAVSGTLSRRNTVTVESESARATLVGVPTVDVGEFVYSHQSATVEQRLVALFDVENKSESPLKWQTARTQFVGDDQYTYQQARLSLDPAKLGPGCHTRQVELPPGRRARVITLVEELPPNVDIVEVIHSIPATGGLGQRERLVFALE